VYEISGQFGDNVPFGTARYAIAFLAINPTPLRWRRSADKPQKKLMDGFDGTIENEGAAFIHDHGTLARPDGQPRPYLH